MQSDDRKLLEDAAKAAGYWDDGYRPVLRDSEGWLCIRPADDKCMFQSIWAPLSNDGDALRLAVRLRLEIVPVDRGYVDVCLPGSEPFACACEGGDDPYAATRRAITRAAASLATPGSQT